MVRACGREMPAIPDCTHDREQKDGSESSEAAAAEGWDGHSAQGCVSLLPFYDADSMY
jgi:hypothetical protein